MSERKRIRLTNGRKLVCDVVRLASKVPSYGLIRDIDVSAVAAIRKRIRPKLSWYIIMMKAYARVAARVPELRQHYVSFPWPHLYEHDKNIALVVIGRKEQGEERLLFARFTSPENSPLMALQEEYDHYCTAPIMEIKFFRRQILFTRFPRLLRRFGYWFGRNVWASKGARYLGTFGVSVSGGTGVYGTQHLSPLTSTIGVDVFSRGGVGKTILTFDHRVIDAAPAGHLFAEIIRELNGPIREEMQQLAEAQASAPVVSQTSAASEE